MRTHSYVSVSFICIVVVLVIIVTCTEEVVVVFMASGGCKATLSTADFRQLFVIL